VTLRTASAVVERVKVRDDRGQDHPRGIVVDLDGKGRRAFYRDVTLDLWIRTARGWALEHGVLEHLIWQGTERVHYRVGGARLLTASVQDFTEHGVPLEANGRSQLVLQDRHWTSYPARSAYEIPSQEHLPWTVLHHQTGEVIGEPYTRTDSPVHPYETPDPISAEPVPSTEALEQQAVDDGAVDPAWKLNAKQMTALDLSSEATEAAKAIVDLRAILEGPVDDWQRVDHRALLQRLAWVATYLMRVDQERRSNATKRNEKE